MPEEKKRERTRLKEDRVEMWVFKPGKRGGEQWCTQDIVIDATGCVYLKNNYLADEIERAIDVKGTICIVRDDPNAPGNKVNVVC